MTPPDAHMAASAVGDGPYIGRPLPRLEDERLLRGQGRYTDDFRLAGELHAAFVRAPHAHAAIEGIEVAEAAAAAGVVAVLTGADYKADGLGGIDHFPNPADAVQADRRAFTGNGGRAVLDLPHLPLATDRVRHMGEPVAVVIAETAEAAADAAELVAVDYRELPVVADLDQAVTARAPRLYDDLPDNIAFEARFGDEAATEQALRGAAVVIEQRFVNQRVANAQMEPRSAIGTHDPATDITTMIAGSQGAVRQRDTLARLLGLAAEKVQVICPDVGGGFGPRTNLYPEQAVVVWAARRLARPVRWTSTRSEAFLADFQGRDSITTARIGLDAEGRITGYAVALDGNVGAHTVSYVPVANGYRVLTTVYDVPTAFARLRGVLTNTVPTAPYRGAGRPEAHFVIERLLDIAARRLGLDRVEIRRRNMVPRQRLPYRNAMGLTYDSGDFHHNLSQALAMADWAGFDGRRAAARGRGRLAGIAVANYVESPVGIPVERVEVAVLADGAVEVVAGTQSTGQGHETSFAQVIADRLGVAPAQVRLVTGDTRRVAVGGGTHSDRTMRLAGQLIMKTTGEILEQGRQVAAHLLAVDPADLAFVDGAFRAPGSNRTFRLVELAAEIAGNATLPASLRRPLHAVADFRGRIPAYPTGAAVCEVEVDPETGVTDIVRYTTVDDVGQPINPLILHGQVHGGIAQGVGQALFETVSADAETGQILSGSFMDYAMPRADRLPAIDVALAEDPTAGNTLRVKGGGESGITPATAVTINAIVDALAPLGVVHVDMPATPNRVWAAIQDASRAGGGGA
ncbi:MAG: xanthine dehydrogenase family protein molybdopterin-binding subunit [Azospirillaceae bacterium]